MIDEIYSFNVVPPARPDGWSANGALEANRRDVLESFARCFMLQLFAFEKAKQSCAVHVYHVCCGDQAVTSTNSQAPKAPQVVSGEVQASWSSRTWNAAANSLDA